MRPASSRSQELEPDLELEARERFARFAAHSSIETSSPVTGCGAIDTTSKPSSFAGEAFRAVASRSRARPAYALLQYPQREIRAMELAKTLRDAGVAGALAARVRLFAVSCAGTTTTITTTTVAGEHAGRRVRLPGHATSRQSRPQVLPAYLLSSSYAYLVNGRWYYETRGRWVVFREEPRELYRYRVYEYSRLEPPRRVRGAEYGTVPQPRPRYYERAQPVPPSSDRYPEAPEPATAPQPVPTQRRVRQPSPSHRRARRRVTTSGAEAAGGRAQRLRRVEDRWRTHEDDDETSCTPLSRRPCWR